jgi:tRNA threonylcarbamoyladenosine biosynthesis protein TsaE
MRVFSLNLEQTGKIAEKFVRKLKKNTQAVIICLKGELGAGKTTFVQLAGKSLGIKKNITSPTFVILKSYNIPQIKSRPQFKKFIHLDTYRLKSAAELNNIGWPKIIKNPENLVFIEWPENVADLIPKESILIELKVIGKFKRVIDIWFKKKKRAKK